MIPVYYCEANGNRLFQYGLGLTQLGQPYQPFLSTWDMTPAGESGKCTFRAINFEVNANNGYTIAITPILDGVPLPTQTFQGIGSGEVSLEAPIFLSGRRIAAQIQLVTVTGDVDVHNIRAAFVPQRQWPQ
jgi:hypothetical protein